MHAVGNENSVFDDFRLLHGAENIPFDHFVAHAHAGDEGPLLIPVEVVDENAPRNTGTVLEKEGRQRTLDPVENARDKPGRELHGKGFARGNDLFPRA